MPNFDSDKVESILLQKQVEEERLLDACETLIQGLIDANTWNKYRDDLSQVAREKLILLARSRKYRKSYGRAYSYLYRCLKNAMITWLNNYASSVSAGMDIKKFALARHDTDKVAQLEGGDMERSIIRAIHKGHSRPEVLKLLKGNGVKRRQAIERYTHAIITMRELRKDRNPMRVGDKKRFCSGIEKLFENSPAEFLLDIVTPSQLIEILRLYAGLSLRFPSFKAINRSTKNAEKEDNTK